MASRSCGRRIVPLIALATALTVVSQPGATPPPPRQVTVIGDSILTAVLWNEEPLSILESGLDIDMNIGVCRRLTGVSCPFEGARVPTLIDVVNERGSSLGQTVLVEVGYNDDARTFAQSVEEAITALLGAGTRQIIWVTMREWQQKYVGMNQDLRAAARRHPELTIVDWNAASEHQYSWFQSDGTHLLYAGAVAMARLLHDALIEVVTSLHVLQPTQLPVAHVGQPYSAQLVAQDGIAPYRWSLTSGPLPCGLRLSADGHLSGRPCLSTSLQLIVRVTDTAGHVASAGMTLIVERNRAQSSRPSPQRPALSAADKRFTR